MMSKMIRIGMFITGLGVCTLLLGCGPDIVGTTARSSLNSFVQTLVNSAVTSVINP